MWDVRDQEDISIKKYFRGVSYMDTSAILKKIANDKYYRSVMADPIKHAKRREYNRVQKHGYCEICDHEYSSIYNHLTTNKHIRNADYSEMEN